MNDEYDENDIIYSPLQRYFSSNGKTVEICIYRLPESGWSLEVVDEFYNSTVWDKEFETDQEALDQFMDEIKEEGIEAFIGMVSGERKH
jgi:hypothetical protein